MMRVFIFGHAQIRSVYGKRTAHAVTTAGHYSSWFSCGRKSLLFLCVFFKVLEHIRLPLIRPSYLHTVVERLEEVVKDQQSCQRFISEAKGEQPDSTNTAHHVEPRGSPGTLQNTCIHSHCN